MNFVTNSSAYSLYPFSTFCHKTSLICRLNKAPTSSIEKYQQHGWDPEFAYADHKLMTNTTLSECKKNIQRIGDTNCWVHHDTTQKNTTYEESVEWCIQYSRDYMEITDNGEVIVAGFYYPIIHIEWELQSVVIHLPSKVKTSKVSVGISQCLSSFFHVPKSPC